MCMSRHPMIHILNTLALMVFIACHQKVSHKIIPDTTDSNKPENVSATNTVLQQIDGMYQFVTPDAIFELDNRLEEISGLSTDTVSALLMAVNDEKGYIYFIEPQSGNIERSMLFSGNGDYEGIELVDNSVYIVNSKGDLFRKSYKGKDLSRIIDTPLNEDNDVEGLAYDERNGLLLLACKASAEIQGINKYSKSDKCIYAYDLKSDTLLTDPFLVLTEDSLEQWLENNEDYTKLDDKLQKAYMQRVKSFAPSAIAIHPDSEDIYLLSAKGNLLIRVNTNHRLENVVFLPDHHRQPEALCFDRNANIFIGNEANGRRPVIYRYDIRPAN